MSRGFGFIGVLVTLVILGIAGTIGYSLGWHAGLSATAGGATSTIVYAPWGFGFPFFGFLFTILFLFLIFGLIRRAAWGSRRMSSGPGLGGHSGRGWDHRDLPPMVDATLRDWHRQAHGEPTGEQAGDDPTTPQTGGRSPA